MNKALRFCIIGRGSIGSRHAANLRSLGCDQIIAFSRDSRSRMDADFYKRLGIRTAHSLSEVRAFRPDAFIIANPTSCHMEYARIAAGMRCHIFMEKPLSDNLAGVEQLRRIFKGKGLVFCMGNNLRFHPALAALKKYVDEGRFGDIYFARIMAGQYLPDWHPGEDYRKSYSARKDLGGGAVLTLQHEIDYAYWLFGSFKALKARIMNSGALGIDVEDLAAVIIEAGSGALIEAHVDYLQRPAKRSIHIQGSKGSVDFSFCDSALRFYDFKRRGYRTVIGLKGYDPNKMYVDEMKDFIDCISSGRAPRSTIADGIYVLNTCIKIKKGSGL
jgi:predicted dehydrogenase